MWPIGLGRYAQQDRVRVKAGETYRQPQASSSKLQAASLTSFKIRAKLRDNKGERK
jgi:hypothetical protein